MNRDEILEKAEKKTKTRTSTRKRSSTGGTNMPALPLRCLLLFSLSFRSFVGGGMNYGLYAVVFSMPMGGFWYKFLKLHKKHELFVAIGYSAVVLLFSVAHIYNMITTSTIL